MCVSVDGTYEITWKLTNDYPAAVTLSDIKLELDKKAETTLSKTPLPTSIDARPANSPLTEVSFTSVVAQPATKVKLTYKAKWADNFRAPGSSGWVQLTGPCPKPSPSKSPSASPSPSVSKSVTPSASNTPSLPVTGSSSTMPLVGTGAALVVGGVALVATLRRRRRVTFTAE
ncbi:LPXTG cell wall anchor domain-containing protein [Dactylosporangium aurantiacum]|uniref:LPXTG cell wall anchor domain-containing protein n=1 Tax=Dactylosporangium aurantiacum TaxID=35754 RepID=A0A9Q9IMK7_9ACTN|nr:LPXTG cell wall anchor domain-containing protein [Dactylosporangium aurantiacum]MDG6104707.1 LPXTG cell wall anchor domain-containing protein [Dactylosporangium aurantiacum]UWZ55725.1 LPXTG cell wall anchor domain-containing protein [Dactylosporangium aurantiacum]